MRASTPRDQPRPELDLFFWRGEPTPLCVATRRQALQILDGRMPAVLADIDVLADYVPGGPATAKALRATYKQARLAIWVLPRMLGVALQEEVYNMAETARREFMAHHLRSLEHSLFGGGCRMSESPEVLHLLERGRS